MEPYSKHEQKIIQVRSPLPFSLRWVNSYLIYDQQGWVLIDPGLHTEVAEQHWIQTLRDFQIEWKQIHSIILTHHHPDHYGLAGWMQERTGAPVYMASRGYAQTQRLWGTHHEQNNEHYLTFLAEHGLPESLHPSMRNHLKEFVALVSPQPKVQSIEPGQTIYLADEPYEILEAHGHAYGHLCFYQGEQQRIFCGDHVMPHITPNVSYLPGVDENPLESYLDSLQRLQTLPVRKAYPGHREPFGNWNERISQLLVHHEHRLEWFRHYMKEPHTAYDACRTLFGDKLTIHQLRFALSETIAHLIFLKKNVTINDKESR
jgi:glyoxylase-like metal-dependent hydrolase (beta-lactamase superfamily II)